MAAPGTGAPSHGRVRRCTLVHVTASRRPGVAAAVAAALMLSGCATGTDAVDQSAGSQFRYVQSTAKGSVIKAAERKPAGPVSGELLAGGSYSLAADRGKVVVLNFWGTWCAPCVSETPQFDTIYRRRRATGVQFVGLDVKDGRGAVRDFVHDKAISYPIVYDEQARTALQLGNIPQAGLPVSAVVDKLGRVAAVYIGPVLPVDLNRVLDTLVHEA